MSKINKRFPANVTLEETTFLNDKHIDAELYALLISYSYPTAEGLTVTKKADLPTQAQMCDIIKVKSTTTFRTHLKYLTESGYIQEKDGYYIFLKKEDIYFDIPLETIQFFQDVVTESVVKAFIYLGQRWKYKPGYVFTLEEVADHIGIKIRGHQREYITLNNILEALEDHGFIETRIVQEGRTFRRKLVNFTAEKPKKHPQQILIQ